MVSPEKQSVCKTTTDWERIGSDFVIPLNRRFYEIRDTVQ
jgi:hypothetical protein